MDYLHCYSMAEVLAMMEWDYLTIYALQSGKALGAMSRKSKTFMSYIAGLMAVSPYSHGACDKSAKGLAKSHLCITSKSLGSVSSVHTRWLPGLKPVQELARQPVLGGQLEMIRQLLLLLG